jgi:hypothetical protein
MAKPDNFPEKQQFFRNPGALDKKNFHFLNSHIYRYSWMLAEHILFHSVITEWWSVTLILLFVMFVTLIYGLDILKSCRQAALCQHTARRQRHLSL